VPQTADNPHTAEFEYRSSVRYLNRGGESGIRTMNLASRTHLKTRANSARYAPENRRAQASFARRRAFFGSPIDPLRDQPERVRSRVTHGPAPLCARGSATDPGSCARYRSGAFGKSAARSIASWPNVSLFWPPREPGGYALVVNGTATKHRETGGVTWVEIMLTKSVLHRPGSRSSDSDGSCTSDCRQVVRPA
jgi:hypothetical protein